MTFRQFAYKNITRNMNAYLAYFLSSAFSVMIFFIFAAFRFHPEILDTPLKKVILDGMTAAEMIIFVFSFLFVLYSVSSFLKARNNEFGTYMILGMSKGQLNRLIFFENMTIGFFSITIGMLIGLVFLKFFLLISAKLLMINELKFYFPLKAICLTGISFFVLFLSTSTFTTCFVSMNKIIDLLKGSRKPKKEPKASIIFSTIGVLLIILGYILAYTAGTNVTILVLPVIGIVTVGTFLFFSQFSVFMVKLLKKKRGFYMKRTNMLWISDLAYRMKDNARLLFWVSIVSAVAFTSIATLYLWDRQISDMVTEELTYAFNYWPYEDDEKAQERIQEIERLLEKENILYKRIKINAVEYKVNDRARINIMNLSEYNEIANVLKIKKMKLDKKEGFLVPAFNRVESQSFERGLLTQKEIRLKEKNVEIQLKELVEKPIVPRSILSTVVVVRDDLFEKVKDTGEKSYFYGYDIKNWKKTLAVSLEFKNNKNGSDIFWSRAEVYHENKQMSGLILFIGFFIGVIFFVAAGSFLYFRFYADLTQEKGKYISMSKIGVTFDEMKKAVTIQMGVLFFTPYVIAFMHTAFALKPLQLLLSSSIVFPAAKVLIGFLMVQIVYFLIIRQRYISILSKYIH